MKVGAQLLLARVVVAAIKAAERVTSRLYRCWRPRLPHPAAARDPRGHLGAGGNGGVRRAPRRDRKQDLRDRRALPVDETKIATFTERSLVSAGAVA